MELEQIIERNFTDITEDYRAFAIAKDKCRQCDVYQHYEQVGQSEGNARNPTFMIVGEALGREEVEQVRPFVGAAGQVLRAELRKHKAFKRTSTIITNILACRPLNNKFPGGDNSPQVKKCTNSWLFKEIKILKPKIIITLGNPALKYVRDEWGITANRGRWKFLHQFKAWSFATYHPSYVMRCKNDGEKRFVVEQFTNDLKAVATMWHTIAGDYRLSMNDDEWKRKSRMDKMIKMGLT